MDAFDEWHSIYIWPKGHVDGDPFPEDFYYKLQEALDSAGIAWEPV